MKHAPALRSDTHFFFRARMLRTLHSEIRRRTASPPALTHTPMLSTSDFPRREGAGRRQDLVENQKSQAFIINNKISYEQNKTNANV